MKTASDDLFRLIKSLTTPEKAYFKKFVSKNAEGSRQNYIVLFDEIDKMDTYDEEILKKKLKDESFLKQLPVYKVYLFNLILKALQLYSAKDNVESRLSEMITNARTLQSKHLYKEALKILRKARESAVKYERFKFALDTLSEERHIILQMPEKNNYDARMNIYNEQKRILSLLSNFYEYSWLCDQMTILVDQEAEFKDLKRGLSVDSIVASPYLSSEDKPTTYYSKFNYYHTMLMYSGTKEDNEKIFYYLKKEIQLAEKHRHILDENPQNYVFALTNFLLYASYTKRQKDVNETLEKLALIRRQVKNKIALETEIQIFFQAVNIEMLIYEKNCEMIKGRQLAKQIDKELARHKDNVPPNVKALILGNLSCFYFLDRNYNDSLKYLNSLLNDQGMNLRSDVYEFGKLFQLLIHFELKNYDLIEYLADSVNKFFKSRKKLNKTHKVLIDFFKKVVRVTEDSFPELYDELLYDLNKARKEDNNDVLLMYFDFISWTESKVKKKTLQDIHKEKNAAA